MGKASTSLIFRGALTDLGHRVTVFAGPPYPELDPRVRLERVPSLDLYRPQDPFRRPARDEFRSAIDVLEYASMCTGAFPEPLTFSLRVARILRARGSEFDVVHDNQGLGYGLLRIRQPLLATIHHPISIDRELALVEATSAAQRMGKRRWYAFVKMQARVVRKLPLLVAVSETAKADTVRDFGVDPTRVTVIPNGVDTDLFRPLDDVACSAGSIVTVASSDQVSKGLEFLVEAVAKLRTERDVTLTVIGRGGSGKPFRRAVERFGVEDLVKSVGRVDVLDMVAMLNRAQVAVVPSLYEGFSLPAIEAMSCGVPLVSTTGGALAEVVGDAGLLVPPGDASALAAAIDRVLSDEAFAGQLGRAGRRRVLERWTWSAAAEALAERYRGLAC